MIMGHNIKDHLANIRGWKTNQKIVVIESDDWGSIRMPSKKTCEILIKKGIKPDNKNNWQRDCLENKEDLENLFSVISKHKDSFGNHPIFTFNTVMGNPDFEKIKESKFESFFHEHFFDSYKRYYSQDLKSTWQEAIQTSLIQPQFHAKEHINVPLWLKDLRNGHVETNNAFNYGFFGLVTKTSSIHQKHYLSAFRAESSEVLNYIKVSTKKGLEMFEDTFGFKSKSFIACNYIWPKELETTLFHNGVTLLQGQRGRFQPNPFKNGEGKIIRNYTGQKNELGQTYSIRNVKFEPFEGDKSYQISNTLKEIKMAFFWKKPAIISTHRINYVGNIDIQQRDRNLKALDDLLKKIIMQWPDVIFLTSDQLGSLMNNKNN